jgi:hypothetical protein
MARNGLDTVIGCASVSMRDGGHFAASLWTQIAADHLAPSTARCARACRCPSSTCARTCRGAAGADPRLPALRRRLMGEPAWDPDFNTADLPLLLRRRTCRRASAASRLISSLAFAELVVDEGRDRVLGGLLVLAVGLQLDRAPMPAASIMTPMMLLAFTRGRCGSCRPRT